MPFVPASLPLQAEPPGSDIPGSRQQFGPHLLGLADIRSLGVFEERVVAAAAAGLLETAVVLAGLMNQSDAVAEGSWTAMAVVPRSKRGRRGWMCCCRSKMV